MKSFLIIGHRGAKGLITENTLPSMQKALDLGVDAIEIDVYKSIDNCIVVFHDKTINRLTNGHGFIEKLTAQEIKKLNLIGGSKIPFLKEVIDLVIPNVILNIELKGNNTAYGVYNILQHYFSQNIKPTQFIIASFLSEEIITIHTLNPQIPTSLITNKHLTETIKNAKLLKVQYIHAYYPLLTKKNVRSIHETGLKVFAWTVNDRKKIKELINIGVDGIISDFPERVSNELFLRSLKSNL